MITYILFNAVLIVMAFIGNLLVMLVFALNRVFHNMKSFLLASLALSDCLSATLVLGPRIVSAVYREWIFGEKWCYASAFLARIVYLNTILHLCAVSHERYRAIVKDHLSYDGCMTPKRIIKSISVLWILPTAVSLGPFLGWGGYEYHPEIYACGQRWDHSTAFPIVVTSFIAPFLFIFVANFKVIRVARRLERKVHVQLGSKNNVPDGQIMQHDQFPSQNGINCQQQDEENIKTRSQKEENQGPVQVIAEVDTSQDPSELWKKTLRKAGQANPGDHHFDRCAGCSQDRYPLPGNMIPPGLSWKGINDPEVMKQPEATEKPISGHLQSPASTLAEHQRNTWRPEDVQQQNPTDVKHTTQGGFVQILKECKAARDVVVIMGAFLVCFLPLWIHGIYHAITGKASSHVVLLCVNSVYATTIICNPIICSVRKKEFRKAVRNLFKI